MEFYAPTKKAEEYFDTQLWGDLPDTMISEKSSVEKSVFHKLPFIQEMRKNVCMCTHTQFLKLGE